MRATGLRIAAIVAILFGALTALSGGSALFGGNALQAAVGDAAPFVSWFNFLSGFVYVAAGVGIWLRRTWARWLAILLVIAIVVVFTMFGLHVAQGSPFEMRPFGAMIPRTAVWIAIAVYLHIRRDDLGRAE